MPNEDLIAAEVWAEIISGGAENSAEAVLVTIKNLVNLIPGLV